MIITIKLDLFLKKTKNLANKVKIINNLCEKDNESHFFNI